MTTYKDQQTGVTAMARATANTISVAAQMIADGTITKKRCLSTGENYPG